MSPLLAVIAFVIKLDSPGPVFFRQHRLGLNGTLFSIYKFRSMVSDAERRGTRFTVGGDDRITPVGRFLRRTKLDELPQLINVLLGEMSLVGPRPEVPEYAELFPREFAQVLRVKPGITHRATMRFRNEEDLLAESADPTKTYIEKIMPTKMQLYIDSMHQQSVRQDIRTIVATILRVGDEMTLAELQIDTPELAPIVSVPALTARPELQAGASMPRVRQTVA
jgi:lipopolysaccharide/colanic/teichoic acid biosynthesis glycosyltransferase